MRSGGALQRVVDRLSTLSALSLPGPPVFAQGRDLRGDHPGFPLLPEARDEAVAAVARGETRYVDGAGIAPLREEAARSLRGLGLEVDAQRGLMITGGEQEARFLAIQALVGAGYRLILPSVIHPGVRKAAAIHARGVVVLPCDPATGAPDPGEIRRALQPAVRTALVLESPNRLTGKVIPAAAVGEISAIVAAANGMVVWDASLAPWVPTDVAYLAGGSLPDARERTVTLGTVWAGAGVEGWMIGYLALPLDLYPLARRLKQIMLLCTSVPVQWGTLGVLREGGRPHPADVETLAAVKAAAAREWPEGVLSGEAVSVVAARLPPDISLDALPVRGMSGHVFGLPHTLRFTVTATGEAVEGVAALARGVRPAGEGRT